MDASFLWIAAGGLFEPLWVVCLERSSRAAGRMHYLYLALFAVFSVCSIYLLGRGMKDMNIGVAYALWTAVGAAGTLVLSGLLLKEPVNYLKVLAVVLILAGIAGLEFAGGAP